MRAGKSVAVTAVVCGVAVCVMSMAQGAVLKGEDPQQNAKLAASWSSIGSLPNLWEGSWQEVSGLYQFTEPVHYSAAAANYVKHYKPGADSVMANCAMPGLPFVMYQGAMPIKFFPTPDMIGLYVETYAVTRFLHTDGRAPAEAPNPTYLGTSVAHWEGDTLVVDSRGFVEETLLQIGTIPPAAAAPPGAPRIAMPIFKKHGPNLRFVERMHMTDYKTLEITTTIYDDTIFAVPYTSTRIWHRHTGPKSDPQEWVCSDNRDFYDEKSGDLYYDAKSKAISTSKAK